MNQNWNEFILTLLSLAIVVALTLFSYTNTGKKFLFKDKE